MRVLVLGASGHYGRQICEGLRNIDGVTVIAAGRNESRVAVIGTQLDIDHVEIDIRDDYLATTLDGTRADIVINAVGPFQGQDYNVAKSCIQAGIPCYIDIADCPQFVKGIQQLNQYAVNRQVMIISGMGLGAVNAAVIDSMAKHFSKIDRITMGYTGSGEMPGLASVKSALSCCGLPVSQVEGGRYTSFTGLHGLNYRYFAGDFAKRGLLNAEMPELPYIMDTYGPSTVRFQKGYGLIGQRPVGMLAHLTKYGLLKGVAGFASTLKKIGNWVQVFSGGKSALFVDIDGRDHSNKQLETTMELLCRKDGDKIQIAPVLALVNQLRYGLVPPVGAYCGIGAGLISINHILEWLDPNSVKIHLAGLPKEKPRRD
ncbi:saccharopine dehydrogenase family protein [Pseudomonas aeruginosa]